MLRSVDQGKFSYLIFALAGAHRPMKDVPGALFATNAIAYAVRSTINGIRSPHKNKKHFGPGFMFYPLQLWRAIGTVLVALIPQKRQNSKPLLEHTTDCRLPTKKKGEGSLEEPLLRTAHPDTQT
jgi:hypothetical protein